MIELAGSLGISKLEFKKLLASFKVGEKNIEQIVGQLDKMHSHVNVLMFTDMLLRTGLHQSDVINILRRIGIDDVSVSNVMDAFEEERIKNTFGKIVELTIE